MSTIKQGAPASEERIAKSLCAMCVSRCGVDIHIKESRADRVSPMPEHFAGLLCEKGVASVEAQYSPQRLLYPQRKVNGKWQRASWDDTFDAIAGKLQEVKEKYGPESFALYYGTAWGFCDTLAVMRRFCQVYGTPNLTSPFGLCLGNTIITGKLTFGTHAAANFSHSNCILLFGHNPHASSPVAERLISRRKKEGAKLIVVDPRTTPTARLADIHARIRPGTDGALILGMLNVIIAEGLYDRAFVEKWCDGFDKLAERVKEYPPQKVETITLVPADTIVQMARMYATSRPASIHTGTSLEQCTNSTQTLRARAILTAICGNFDVAGGQIPIQDFPFKQLAPEERQPVAPALGQEEYPLFHSYGIQEAHWSIFTRHILSGKPYPIKALMVLGGNPALVVPDSGRVLGALKSLEFLVTMDTFWTDTMDSSHMALPMCSYLERAELAGHVGVPIMVYQQRVFPPQGESMSLQDFLIQLARRMGYERYFPWERSEDSFDYLLEPVGLTLEQLRSSPGGKFFAPRQYKRYEKEGFKTPSGKVELYSRVLAQHGYDPLPGYVEPAESPLSRPELAKEYPLILSTGARLLCYSHSQHRNLSRLRSKAPEPQVEISNQNASQLGIRNGDDVVVESPRGSIQVKALVTEDILPGVVQVTHGWSQANANLLVDSTNLDPVTGYASMKALLCRVKKATASPRK